MAKLSAKGRVEIGRVEYLSKTSAYFTNGDVLANQGFGWKEWGKVKAGVDPLGAYQRAIANQAKFLLEHPAYAAWRSAVMDAAPLSRRWRLVAAIKLMPEDPDGVWSEVCDGYGDNLSLSIDEVVELCKLYRASEAAHKSSKEVEA